ncbi:MAG TPA: tetratricopeptide repeat protein [Chloroflexi bacterium]|nr:tetratricopeptide repeat protein [Chloroflexota bacterium]
MDATTQSNEMAQAIAAVGRSYHYEGQIRQAIDHFERALEIAEPEDDAATLTLIYTFLSGAHQHLLEFGPSMEWARKLIELGQRKGHPEAMRLGYEYRAENSFAMGRWADALEFAAEDQRIGEELGFLGGSGWAHFCLATSYYGLGLLPAAQEAARKSLEAAELTGDLRLAVLAGARLAIIEGDRGQVEEAREQARQSADRGEEIRHTFLLCAGREALAHNQLLRREPEAALVYLGPCTSLPPPVEYHLTALIVGPRHAEAALLARQPKLATEVINRTLHLAVKADSAYYIARLQNLRAQALAMQGDWAQAEQEYEQAIRQLDAQDSRLELGRALLSFGRAQADHHQQEDARASLKRALQVLEECDAQYWVGQASETLRGLDDGVPASPGSIP